MATNDTVAMSVSSFHPAFPMEPNCQKTMVDSAYSLNMYCSMLMPAEKMELSATPARTMVSGLTFVTLTNSMMMPVAIMAHANALIVTIYGLFMDMVAWLCPEIIPPPRTTIPMDAPKAAALDIPSVYGEPRGFFRTHCMTAPAIPRANPANMHDSMRGMPRSQTKISFTKLLEGSFLLNMMWRSSL